MAKCKKEQNVKSCESCRYYYEHECYLFHNWEASKICSGKGKFKWRRIKSDAGQVK